MQRYIGLYLSFLLLPFFFLESSENWIPVAYKGRVRPLEAYARLWLYDVYHAQSFKKQHKIALSQTPLQKDQASAQDLIWSLLIEGSSPFESTPLFWLQSAELKTLAGLNPKHNHFSYQELYRHFYEEPSTSTALFKHLILYHALKTYQDPANRSRSNQLELSKLSPGLWVRFQGSDLTLVSVPSSIPWSHLNPGEILVAQVKEQASSFMRNEKDTADGISDILSSMQQFKGIEGMHFKQEAALKIAFEKLLSQKKRPQEIEQILEQSYPLINRLRSAGTLLKVLPGRYPTNEWFSLPALKTHLYQSSAKKLTLVSNFTLFSDEDFETIRQSYFAWEQSLLEKQAPEKISNLHKNLLVHLGQAYKNLDLNSPQIPHQAFLSYPSITQLKIEAFYYQYPLIELTIFLYGLAALGFLIMLQNKKRGWANGLAYSFLILAFGLHTCILAIRCYILSRPPVSNMFETVIYVPWIAVFLSLLLYKLIKNNWIVVASCLISLILLVLLQVTDLNQNLENVQPVLNSQFWLIIHVLMVVGSYGVFILGGVLGHIYLISRVYKRQETATIQSIAAAILQTLYIGTALLISGTILGGVWAAESWGRFWDWDPKESWAFISSCVYLIIIHAYRFHKISHLGLAIGSILGLIAISFTWYGVNYILGTGLHSYGFGSGGQGIYYLFLAGELLFVGAMGWMAKKRNHFISRSTI